MSQPISNDISGCGPTESIVGSCDDMGVRRRQINILASDRSKAKRLTGNHRRESGGYASTVPLMISLFFINLITTLVPTNTPASVHCTQSPGQLSLTSGALQKSPQSHQKQVRATRNIHDQTHSLNLQSAPAASSALPIADWAQRIPMRVSPRSFDVLGSAANSMPQAAIALASMLASHRPGSLITSELARPKILPEFVANQGQRILRNIANVTTNALSEIAVNQQMLGGPPAPPRINDLNFNLLVQSLNQSQQSSEANTNSRFRPTMNKLYSYLFANQTNSPGSAANSSEGSTSFARTSQSRPMIHDAPNDSRSLLSLGAPYESRDRTRRLVSSSNNLTEGRWRREHDLGTSAQTNILYPDTDLSEAHDQDGNLQEAVYTNLTEAENQQTGETDPKDDGGNQWQLSGVDHEGSYMSGDRPIDQYDPGKSTHTENIVAAKNQYNSDHEARYQDQGDTNVVEQAEEPQVVDNQPNGQIFDSADGGSDTQYHAAEPDKASLTSGLPSDNSALLAAQLPSQYDAVMRLPPDGYYDDYFKPQMSNLVPQSLAEASMHQGTPLAAGQFKFASPEDYQRAAGSREAKQHFDPDDSTSSPNTTSSNETKFLTPPIDYTAQYYMNQQPLKQQEFPSGGDHNIEFIAANRTAGERITPTADPANSTQLYNYERHNYNGTRDINDQSNGTLADNQGERIVIVGANLRQVREKLLNVTGNHQSDNDSIHVILANTNSTRDPISNEKVINYIREGQNATLTAGKPPRSTFVNRDMNEFPPVENYTSATGDGMSSTEIPLDTRYTPSPIGNSKYDQQIEPQNHQAEDHRDSSGYAAQDQEINDESDPNEDKLMRLTVNPASFGRYNTKQGAERSSSGGDHQVDGQTTLGGDRRFVGQGDRSLGRSSPQADHDRRKKRRDNKSTSRPNRSQNSQTRPQQQMQTIRRPQVTQVHINPKNLILSPPTPQPTLTESAYNTMADLPSNVRKVHDNPPDKQELMNELLTALDRVKAAIYKLQPLTAKMNAMYRKSVTSNTRDIIMDHHKGTYAKRYPPGDYDDTYDRMHPSETLFRGQSRSGGKSSSRRRRTGNTSSKDMESSGSVPMAVYLPAPAALNMSDNHHSAIDGLNSSESQIVATGIGRRLGHGKIVGQLSLRSGSNENIILTDDIKESGQPTTTSNLVAQASANRAAELDSAAPIFVPTDQLVDADGSNMQNPLFGYRITIFQSPDDEGSEGITLENSNNFAYELEGRGDSGAGSVIGNPMADDDSMVTSESTIAETSLGSANATETANDYGDSGDLIDGSESSKHMKKKKKMDEMEKKKKMAKKSEHKKKAAKENAEKKGEKSKKSMMHKKKDEEESKKKKEYKKIKHNKGIISKEKKTMHRDKHIKAHDRGAAKEKALKERTQIEFFEREQIVDDEFEKAKKSTMKAGWQSGHDSKKTSKDILGGDTMSMGASHLVKHEPKDTYVEKGHGMSSEASSAKESNKFEKKNMEAKGKKFKGWREKGYKIITETEFIDRGSLHDSAYKKRDKGAAHHQKYKKQESMSEGHHGSMQEHHKKVHKKEEKKHKMNEKKDEHMKKEEKKDLEKKKKEKEGSEMEKEKKKKMEKHSKDDEDHELEESAATINPLGQKSALYLIERGSPHDRERQHDLRELLEPRTSVIPSTFRPANSQHRPESLVRLLSSSHDHDQQVDVLERRDSPSKRADEPNLHAPNSTLSSRPAGNLTDFLSAVDTRNATSGAGINPSDEKQGKSRVSSSPLEKIASGLARFLPSAAQVSLAPAVRSTLAETDRKSITQQPKKHEVTAEKTKALNSEHETPITDSRATPSDPSPRANGSKKQNQVPLIVYNDAANKAAQLMHLLQRASQIGAENEGAQLTQSPLPNLLIDLPLASKSQQRRQQQVAMLGQSAYLQQQLPLSQTNSIFSSPASQFSFGPNDLNALGPDQLLDYDQESLLAQLGAY